jgi:hypothetical protein
MNNRPDPSFGAAIATGELKPFATATKRTPTWLGSTAFAGTTAKGEKIATSDTIATAAVMRVRCGTPAGRRMR